MQDSEQQFQELIAQLLVRSNKALKEGNELPPMGLALTREGSVKTIISLQQGMQEALNQIQGELQEKVKDVDIVATCVSYPDYANEVVVALLENNENYASQLKIAVQNKDGFCLDINDIEVSDSNVYIFPASS